MIDGSVSKSTRWRRSTTIMSSPASSLALSSAGVILAIRIFRKKRWRASGYPMSDLQSAATTP